MNTPRSLVCLLVLGAFVLCIGQPPAQAQDAETIFARLLDKYNTIRGLRASFTQTMTSAYLDGAESFSGRLILQGDQYRIETGTEVLIVNDLETVVYRPQEKQVLLNDVVDDEHSFSPSDFLLHYDERFEVMGAETVQHEGVRHYRIRLTPKDATSFFRTATLWMRDRDAIITRVEVEDANETRMVFDLDEIEINPRLDANTFRFTPPEGVEVIDLRS